ncbi:MAG: polymer-forming cytoskeletal protein [Anaerolineales bacterium]|nr:polymer-forming cytoskeletal protein [Anaerolineales bacterium]
MKPVKLLSFFLLLALVFAPLQSASAKGLAEGKVIFGDSYTLKSGETLNGDLVVFGGSANIEKGAKVEGNAVVIGGSLVVNGEVTGDVAVVGGAVTLGAESRVRGNLSTVGAMLTRSEGSRVDGEIFNTATSWQHGENGTQTPQTTPSVQINFQPFWTVVNVIGQALALGILAMLVMLFLTPQTQRVGQAIVGQPVIAGLLGLLTVVLAPLALVLLIITILLIPVALVAVIALALAAVFGWIAIGLEIGERFTKAIKQQWHPSLAAGLGTFLLALVANIIGLIVCVGWLAPFLVTMLGIGGVIMTRFGARPAESPVAATN